MTGLGLRIASFSLQISGGRSAASGFGLQVSGLESSNSGIGVRGVRLRVSGFGALVLSFGFRAASFCSSSRPPPSSSSSPTTCKFRVSCFVRQVSVFGFRVANSARRPPPSLPCPSHANSVRRSPPPSLPTGNKTVTPPQTSRMTRPSPTEP